MTKKGGESRGQKTVEKNERTSSEPDSNEDSTGLTGSFVTDFPALCVREGLCPIEVVTRLQTAPADEKDEHSVGVVCQPNRVFFRSKIVADVEDDGGKESVKAIHLRGWLLDERVLNVLSLSIPSCSHLTTIKLWNVGLTEQTFATFTALVIQFRIKQVILSGNPLASENYASLLSDETSLERLGLRGNGLTDRGAKLLADTLSANNTLIFLDLAHNRISSEGTKLVANALRMNRTLLSLSLANNKVDDEGAESLAEVVSRFALSHLEIIARRMFNAEKRHAEAPEEQPGRTVATTSMEKRGGVKATMSSDKMAREKREKTPGIKKRESKREEKVKKDEKEVKTKKALSSADGKKGKVGKGGSKKGTDTTSEEMKTDILEHGNPLTEAVEEIGGNKFIIGNRALTNINLSYNAISEDGIAALLKAVRFQSTLCLLPGTGLMRLSVEHNKILSTHEDLVALRELMLTKDPLYKSTDSESVSTTQEER